MGKIGISKRLIEFRNKYRYSQKDIADILGITRSSISYFESGKITPSMTILNSYEYNFGISHKWLLTGEGSMHLELPDLPAWIRKKVMEMKTGSDSQEYMEIPFFKQLLCAGDGSYPDLSSKIETFIKIPKIYALGKDLIAFLCIGESMEPVIPNNSIVIANINRKELENGQVGAFFVDGFLYLRRYYKEKSLIILNAVDPKHTPISIDTRREDMEKYFGIIGKIELIVKKL